MLFDEQPELFVDLARVPVVFTLRGVRHFAPRFRHVGVQLAQISNREQFEAARKSWDQVEYQLLQERISKRAKPGRRADPYNALQAVLNNDADAFETHIRALEHQQRAGLTVVRPDSRTKG